MRLLFFVLLLLIGIGCNSQERGDEIPQVFSDYERTKVIRFPFVRSKGDYTKDTFKKDLDYLTQHYADFKDC